MCFSPVPHFFVILLFFFTQVMCMSSHKNAALLQQVCEKTHNYSLCVSSLKSDPRGLKAELKNLVIIMMDIALVNAIKTSELIIRLNKTISDPHTNSHLDICGVGYEVARGDFQKAINAFELSSYKESYEYLGSAGAIGPTFCENNFAEPPARKSPLTATNTYIASLTTIADDIFKIFMDHK